MESETSRNILQPVRVGWKEHFGPNRIMNITHPLIQPPDPFGSASSMSFQHGFNEPAFIRAEMKNHKLIRKRLYLLGEGLPNRLLVLGTAPQLAHRLVV